MTNTDQKVVVCTSGGRAGWSLYSRKKDRRSNGCFPRTEEAVDPYRGEERVQIRSEPGAALSAKPLDDRFGEAAMLNAAICTAFGARRGVPDLRLLGPGMRRGMVYQLTL